MKKTENPNVLVIRIKPELKKQIIEILEEKEMSIAQLVRTLLKEFSRKNKKKGGEI